MVVPRGSKRLTDLAPHRSLAIFVYSQHGLHDAKLHVMVLCDLDQRTRVLWKARATEAGTGMQELRANAIVQADPARDRTLAPTLS